MNEVKQKIQKQLNIICDQFIEEEIGSAKLNLMPPIDKVPIITNMKYEKEKDTFEIYFSECDEPKIKSKENIDFFEDQYGHLIAIHIRRFSKLNIDQIKINVITTIKNEIKQAEIAMKQSNIPDNIIDKRKLMFLNAIVRENYNELKTAYVK